jgi:DNA-binding CsgD family transcriptional regulator
VLEQTPEITPAPRERGKLSARELEVLEMAALGLTNAEIAVRLAITVHAIKFHLASIYRKLGVGNRTEAAVAFLELRHQQSPVT